MEYVTPIKKVKNALKITDLRKIAKTPGNSKCFEGFIKEWILEDIEENLDPSQYGSKKRNRH